MTPTRRRNKRSANSKWSVTEALGLYGIDAWGRGYFSVNDRGHLTLAPDHDGEPVVDLPTEDVKALDIKDLVDEVGERGIGLPLLIRFSDLLEKRIDEIHQAFLGAISEYEYRGAYRGVYPIKVNQNRFLVEDLVRHGERYHYGLEAGSKPELLAVIAMLADPQALIVCNGYKDEDYVETALLASRLGPKVLLVVEKPAELRLIIDVSRRLGIAPHLGIRAKLAARGAGHWQASGGDRSKFGLGARELMEAVELLRTEDLLDRFELLHFHLGSQISAIRNVKMALRESAWLYVNLVQLGAPLTYFDVGGGLGVDYDGSQSEQVSSMNYSLQEYANDIVAGLMEVCDPAGVEHPVIVTECGRASVAHHALLVIEAMAVGEFRVAELPVEPPADANPVIGYLLETYRDLDAHNVLESYHDAQQYREDCLSLFGLGHLPLAERVLAEDIYWAICRRARDLVRDLPYVPPDLQAIEAALADTYFCNFSLFQSLPDSWAIDQLFPVAPIHRLDERPNRVGVLADMTCDSDGKIDRFVSSQHAEHGHAQGHDPLEPRRALELHAMNDEPYHLGIFLVGAYQEILGDLHNLFGDTNTVRVSRDGDGGYIIDHVVAGDSVSDVLAYVGFDSADLIARIRRLSERALRDGRLTRKDARKLLRRYQQGLAGYTYLESED